MTKEQFEHEFKLILTMALAALKRNFNLELKTEKVEARYNPVLLKSNIESLEFRFNIIYPGDNKRHVATAFNKGGYVEIPETMCKRYGFDSYDSKIRSLSKLQQNILRMASWLYSLGKDHKYI